MTPIKLLPLTLDVEPAYQALIQSPHWDVLRHRTADPTSPHHLVRDIWARYGSLDDPKMLNNQEPFECQWFHPELTEALEPLTNQLMQHVGGTELGGVLITLIPAYKYVKPHTDGGWHAGYYSKYAIAIRANEEQAFCFDEAELSVKTGDVWFFDNSERHWVTNQSDEDRISMICCIKTPRGIHEA